MTHASDHDDSDDSDSDDSPPCRTRLRVAVSTSKVGSAYDICQICRIWTLHFSAYTTRKWLYICIVILFYIFYCIFCIYIMSRSNMQNIDLALFCILFVIFLIIFYILFFVLHFILHISLNPYQNPNQNVAWSAKWKFHIWYWRRKGSSRLYTGTLKTQRLQRSNLALCRCHSQPLVSELSEACAARHSHVTAKDTDSVSESL